MDRVAGLRQVVFAVFDGVGVLDVTGPAEVFMAASRLSGRRRGGYAIRLAAARPGPVRTSGAFSVVADSGWDELEADVDTVIVPGALTVDAAGARPTVDRALVKWLADNHSGWRRIASVCAGAHMLAEAGLLAGRTATTHWFSAPLLAHDHPSVTVDADPIYLRDGRIWTSAGVSSGMDLALAMVADDHGERLAREVARWLVLYLRRPGTQSQFAAPLAAPGLRDSPIRDVQVWLAGHLDEDLSVPALARRANLSERHFARVFIQHTSTTPAAYVEASRAEAARRLLEESDLPVEAIAIRCGFGSVETLYRTFRRRLGTTPADYRQRFRI